MSWWSSRSAPPSPQVVVETAPKRVRTDAARPSSTAALPTSNSFEALAKQSDKAAHFADQAIAELPKLSVVKAEAA